jgi:uncharacterized membrane protein
MIKISSLLIAAAILLGFNSSAAMAGEKSARKVNSCFGTEPFWELEITNKVVQFKDAGNNIVMTIPKVTPATAEGTNEDYIAMYQGKTIDNPNKFMNVVIVGDANCSDDMSEQRHPFFVLVLSGKKLYRGCCN